MSFISEPALAAVMQAGMGGLIVLIAFIVIAIISALLKRRQPDEEWDLPPELKPRRDQPPRPPVSRWEEELRRVLDERPLAPPVIREIPPREMHPPLFPVPFEPQPAHEPETEGPLAIPHPRIEHTFQHLPGLTEAPQRFSQAATLEQRVQHHLHHVTTHRIGATSVKHAELSPEARELLTSLHSRKGMRSAVLAAIILGPPRALEN